jgi:hypothetical protein
MVDMYHKGQPHTPRATVAGHYLGMHAVDIGAQANPMETWYRGDDYLRLVYELGAQDKRIKTLESQLALRNAALEVRRRPPKRADGTS